MKDIDIDIDYFDEFDCPEQKYEVLGTVILDCFEGYKMEFEIVDLIEYENNEYAVLLPIDESDFVVTKHTKSSDGEDFYDDVNDIKIYHAVLQLFIERAGDKFDL